MVVRTSHRRFAGVRTRVLEAGPAQAGGDGRAPRLVLLHGYCDSADTFSDVLEELDRAGRGAVAVDLCGFGSADALRQGPILPQLDAFVAGLVREQSMLGPVVLVGNSLGGTLALRAAQQAATPVAGIVSIAAPGLADSWLVRTLARYPLPLRLYHSLPVPVPGMLVRGVAERVIPRLLYADRHAAAPEHVQRFTELFVSHRRTTARLEQARQLLDELEAAYQPELIQLPLLIVACGKDRLVSAAAGRQLHALVPHSRLLVRQDWGHCPQLDDPGTVAELLTSFAASVRQADQDRPAPARRRKRATA